MKTIKRKEGYRIIKREDMINNIIGYISEATHDKELMKEDLKMLLLWECELIYSSEDANEYLEIKTK